MCKLAASRGARSADVARGHRHRHTQHRSISSSAASRIPHLPHSASEWLTRVPLPDCPSRVSPDKQTTLTPPRSGRVDLEAPQIFERVGEVIFERVEEVLGEALRAHAGGRRVEGLEQVV